jgi:hypothetical protein
MSQMLHPLALAVTAALMLGACSPLDAADPAPPDEMAVPAVQEPPRTPSAAASGARTEAAASAPGSAAPRPAWLGTRVLPLADDGFGQRLPTPAELVDRRLVTPPLPDPTPPPPPTDGGFAATVADVPRTVAARSTWHAGCPVTLAELRYVTVTFHGFDGRTHTGELLVHSDVADDVVRVFAALHAGRFPIEELRIIAPEELGAPPTGDGNVTSAFVCRATVGGSRWSDHAFGRAIDVNPFHNPYVRGDLVIPELASSYVARDDVRPGMVIAGDVVTRAFAAIGWGWGGDWTGTATDPMHFSSSGR